MTPINFPQVNLTLAKDQPEYLPLPVFVNHDVPGVPMTYCMQLTPEEIEQVNKTGHLWLTQSTFGHPFQPIYLSTLSPFQEEQWPANTTEEPTHS